MLGVSLTTWALSSLCIFLAAFIRGFTGFGLAVVGVPLLSLFFAPAEIVPSIMILAIIAGLQLIPKIWHRVDWKLLLPTVLGAAIGTPLGTWLLAGVSADVMRVLIGAAVLAASLAVQLGFRFARRPHAGVSAGFGAIAGLTGGAAAMPGPSVIFLFLAVPIAHEAGRASLILFFQISAAMSAVSAAVGGLLAVQSLILGALLVPAMLAGNYLGDRVFDKASAKTYRRMVVLLLAGLGAVAAIRGVIGLI
ncbi:sulfite exporter TauE/SafE family protein [Dongia sedimenti]|uniref:Probable membrane transporter protein n=1 Tax=Dongia sedimenti TaxID=3064282 RepID=A0ABU0YWD9_9PROT|nr:sulfite exporter TauE/SafE family protein [Rhodospirillaceae bacterium R-7]